MTRDSRIDPPSLNHLIAKCRLDFHHGPACALLASNCGREVPIETAMRRDLNNSTCALERQNAPSRPLLLSPQDRPRAENAATAGLAFRF
jgi:hypothetical protein